MIRFLVIILLISVLSSCASSQAKRTEQQEMEAALGSVVSSSNGKVMNDKEMRQLSQQLRKDKDAQTAVKAIAGSMSETSAAVKYCPKGGERYSAKVDICPVHNVKLKYLNENK